MPPPRTYPLALAHGIARFDFLRESFVQSTKNPLSKLFRRLLASLASRGVAVDRLHYFRGISTALAAAGFGAHHTSAGFAEGLKDRAALLEAQIRGVLASTGAEKVHIIAHSMGGLDARYMIARRGMANSVASLTTIGTPHLGTSYADHKLKRGGDRLIEMVERVVNLAGFRDLTREACRLFGDEVRNAEAASGVFYQTYASSQERETTFAFLQPSWDVIKREEGDNDGLVSVASQAWQPEIVGDDGTTNRVVQKKFPVPADHLNQVGWWDLNEIHGGAPALRLGAREKFEEEVRRVYLDIAADLAARFPVK
jgi:triacylglycerol lipase